MCNFFANQSQLNWSSTCDFASSFSIQPVNFTKKPSSIHINQNVLQSLSIMKVLFIDKCKKRYKVKLAVDKETKNKRKNVCPRQHTAAFHNFFSLLPLAEKTKLWRCCLKQTLGWEFFPTRNLRTTEPVIANDLQKKFITNPSEFTDNWSINSENVLSSNNFFDHGKFSLLLQKLP